ncbi:hypothetical protein HmCmsJML001_03072 [Escherichia coli]|nr:hypothetical protein HmCmsJML001_03072 [Escherichia coli]
MVTVILFAKDTAVIAFPPPMVIVGKKVQVMRVEGIK